MNTYKNSSDHLTIYTVNMNSPFNSKYSSTSSNTNPSNASEMKINGPTLIKFGNNKQDGNNFKAGTTIRICGVRL